MSIMRTAVVAVAILFVGVGAVVTAADEVAIVVNKANPVEALTLSQLRKFLLGQEAKWPGGKKIVVIMTTPGQLERTALLKTVCNMRETDFTLYFMHASFNGESGDPPKNGGLGLQVRQLVAANPDAIGVIKASQVDGSVKVLAIDGSTPGQAAYKLKMD